MWGTRLTVGDSQIKKIKDPTTAIDFPRYIDPLVDTPQSGDWYVTEVNSTNALAVDTLLNTGKFYHVYFYIEDNDPDFDLDPTDGIIKDPNVTGQTTSGGTSASFGAFPTVGQAPLTVNFTDQSRGEITSWEWDFGDGSTSSQQHPSHTYTNLGSYTVSLTVTDILGIQDTYSRTITLRESVAMPWIPLLLLDD